MPAPFFLAALLGKAAGRRRVERARRKGVSPSRASVVGEEAWRQDRGQGLR